MAKAKVRLLLRLYVIKVICSLYLPKTKNFDYVGRGDLTSLFKSCEIDRSQERLV